MSRFSLFVLSGLFAVSSVAQDTPVTPKTNSIHPAVAEFAAPLHKVKPPAETPKLPAELEELFAKMEASAKASREAFEPLSVAQMNFRPANGSHTPRWNVEHMSGVQLRFFSQIYHALDENIPVITLMPKQMPDDYEFRHADWTGAMEADWIGEVSDYCRRHAHLLADIDVDAKPPATRWPTLRALLVQMDNHYKEHTANVQKKFALEGWPE